MRIVCLGDSLTRGYGIQRKKCWTNLAADKTGYHIDNFGIIGDTTGGMLARLSQILTDIHPDMIFLMGGVNDLLAGCDPGIPQSNIMSMVHQSYALGVTPVVGIPPLCDVLHLRKDWAEFGREKLYGIKADSYGNWLRDFGKTFRTETVDFAQDFLNSENPDGNYLDGIHPSEQGHQLMANTFSMAIEKIRNKNAHNSTNDSG